MPGSTGSTPTPTLANKPLPPAMAGTGTVAPSGMMLNKPKSGSMSAGAGVLSGGVLGGGAGQVNGAQASTTGGAGASSGGQQDKQSMPRIDMEPLYTALKAAIGDGWGAYKEAMREFFLGRRNQAEFTRETEHLFQGDLNRLHLHNQFVCAIMTNAGRDPPEPGVATWVSANDKPSAAAAKPAPGDETEKRIKTEVMALPARERHRIKTIHDEPFDAFNQTMMDYHTARQIRAPETVPASAGGMNKMNLDLEIRKRYAQPLFSETFEFPDQDSISARITPICYEEGLANGATTGCSEIINVATEYYIKEVIAAVYFPTRSAALKTALSTPSQKSSQKQQNSRGKRGAGKGPSRYPVKSNGGGRTGPITIEEFRLAMELGTGGTSNVPIPFAQMLLAQHEQFDYSSTTAYDPPPAAKPLAIVPGADAQTDAMVADEAEGETDNLGWRGSSARDRQKLVGVLDDCLAVRL